MMDPQTRHSVQTFDACLTINVRPSLNLVNLVNLDIQSQAMAKVTAKRGNVARC